ncbi:YcxB family protein [Streptomyces sp. bgisy034]|uniref:YcxB family protein n=1 Tax=Streptomyces sp. bgisy034 TaxID=3413774 RepID=UPI003EC06231
MTTEAQQVGERRVEIRHVTTADQFLEALRAHAKVSLAARRQRWFVAVVALLVAAMAVRITPQGGSVQPAGLLIAVLLLLFGLVLAPRMTARSQQRIHEVQGERRITVDESGVSVETDHTFARFGWPAMSRYVETRRLFVLVSADKRASCLVILPKQGVDGRDESVRLRALLDGHLAGGEPRFPASS